MDRDTIKAEKDDAEAQIKEAQAQISAWQQKALIAEGARQALVALLNKIDDAEVTLEG